MIRVLRLASMIGLLACVWMAWPGLGRAEEALPVSVSIGRVNIAGYNRLQMCSGTLVAPDLVLTAAHCVTDPETGATRRVSDMVFVAGWDGAGHSGAARVAALDVHPEAYASGRLDIAHDLALVTLVRSLALPVVRVGQTAASGPFELMGYPRSAPQRLRSKAGCRGAQSRGLWLIGCPVERGQSGGPVFFGEAEARRLVAIIVGRGDAGTLAVPVDGWLRRRLLER